MWGNGVFGESVFQRPGKNAVYSVGSDSGEFNRRQTQTGEDNRLKINRRQLTAKR